MAEAENKHPSFKGLIAIVASLWTLPIAMVVMILGKERIDESARAITMKHDDIAPKEEIARNAKRAYELTVADSLRLREALQKVAPESVVDKVLGQPKSEERPLGNL